MLGGSGHIAGVINHPAKNKYHYWTGGPVTGELDDWITAAHQTPGSWWPLWHDWLKQQDPAEVKARKPGNRKYKTLGDAPGTYVLAKS